MKRKKCAANVADPIFLPIFEAEKRGQDIFLRFLILLMWLAYNLSGRKDFKLKIYGRKNSANY